MKRRPACRKAPPLPEHFTVKPRSLLLLALQTNRTAEWKDGVWQARCLHCRKKLRLTETGRGIDAVTLEHIVPRSWFGQRAARIL